MIQDCRYLLDYVKVFATGITKAADDEEIMRSFATSIHVILNEEMAIHKSYMARLGITEQEIEATPMALDNASYTAYMLAQGQMGGAPEVLAAILSCAWSYEVIAKGIVERWPESLDHPLFGEWVRGYASEGYAAGNQRIFAFVERVCADLSEAHMQRLCEVFVNCSRYEAMFWDMAYEMKR